MKIGEYVQKYRREHGLSMQSFGDMCGLSRAYISVLERGINPTTNRPLTPTLDTLKKIADVTNVTLDALLQTLDNDDVIKVNSKTVSSSDVVLAKSIGKLLASQNEEQRKLKIEIIKDVVQLDLTLEQLQALSMFLKTMK